MLFTNIVNHYLYVRAFFHKMKLLFCIIIEGNKHFLPKKRNQG